MPTRLDYTKSGNAFIQHVPSTVSEHGAWQKAVIKSTSKRVKKKPTRKQTEHMTLAENTNKKVSLVLQFYTLPDRLFGGLMWSCTIKLQDGRTEDIRVRYNRKTRKWTASCTLFDHSFTTRDKFTATAKLCGAVWYMDSFRKYSLYDVYHKVHFSFGIDKRTLPKEYLRNAIYTRDDMVLYQDNEPLPTKDNYPTMRLSVQDSTGALDPDAKPNL